MSKAPIALTWDCRVFHPADPYSAEQAAALPKDVRLNARVTKAIKDGNREGQLRLWWAGLGLLVENIDDPEQRWPTSRKMHNLILEELGFVEKIWRIDGSYRLVVDSVALDNMDDDSFDRLFEMARAFCVEHFGFDPWDAWIAEQEAAAIQRRRGFGN